MPPEPANPIETILNFAIWLALPVGLVAGVVVIVIVVMRSQRKRALPPSPYQQPYQQYPPQGQPPYQQHPPQDQAQNQPPHQP
ncbi:hypothetical protein E1263_07570 [Kribbella antibiotica]|uniref:Uncharacterized protein n=1 Tax=Kribbella antibiotica TaxID=190195 RepID=A0A4R4ZSK2_9ACTN|nr:hypothetical protein [Kribbella antibiotica]TDD61360.1 hypothetical protein E1263_07570 [Kribbella antibiotica]